TQFLCPNLSEKFLALLFRRVRGREFLETRIAANRIPGRIEPEEICILLVGHLCVRTHVSYPSCVTHPPGSRSRVFMTQRASRVLRESSCSGDRRGSRVTTDLPKGRASRRRDHQTRFATTRKLCPPHRGRRKPQRFDTQSPLGPWRADRLGPRRL